MLFDWNAVAAPGQVQDVQPCAPLTLTGDGLWVCLVSSGRCTASVPSAGPLPAGYLAYFQWAKLPPWEKAAHWTLKRGGKLICGAVRSLTEAEYAALEKTYICCTVAAVSDCREPLLPHFHVEGS